ncbi:MAG TPA: DUF2975 domain-containing protein [Microbacterium sp.]|nr:DUF2975 domain-containing protein [Microbacterium sp.]
MTTWATRAAQALLILGGLGSLVVQFAIVMNVVYGSPHDALSWVLAALALVFVACVEVAIVCLWRLLTFARSDAIFSTRAFRFVDVIVGCCVAAGALIIVVAAILAPMPDVDGPPPGMILIFGLVGAGCWGIGLLVVVMRGLLTRAIAWRDELEAVI